MKKIALISPSSPAPTLTPDTLARLKALFEDMGWQLHLGSHALDSLRHLAGTDADRAADVMRAFADDDIDLVLTVRGGCGSQRILDLLDYDTLKQHKKPFWTLSDGTALQTAISQEAEKRCSDFGERKMFSPDRKNSNRFRIYIRKKDL